MKKIFSISKEELYQLYVIENKTVAELAKAKEVSVTTINRFLKKYEIKKDNSLRVKKISEAIHNRTEEEKLEYSAKISTARKGKGLGIVPWNKGTIGLQRAWNKGIACPEEVKQKISFTKQNKSEKEKAEIEAKRLATRIYGTPWNKGLPCPKETREKISQTLLNKSAEEKIYLNKIRANTRHKNNTFITSNIEEIFYNNLIIFYKDQDIIRQYQDDRYPFKCDFYIKPIDMFIELNINWTHGFMPYISDDPDCQKQLTLWQNKAIESNYYKNAIYTWTDLDVRKQQIAIKNKLLYMALYSEQDCIDFINYLETIFNEVITADDL